MFRSDRNLSKSMHPSKKKKCKSSVRGGGGSKPKPPMNNEVPKLPEKYAFSLSMRKKKSHNS